jgi:hypothetical protein
MGVWLRMVSGFIICLRQLTASSALYAVTSCLCAHAERAAGDVQPITVIREERPPPPVTDEQIHQ